MVFAAITLVLGAGASWLWLPCWAPEWVEKHSPWFDPAFRAALSRHRQSGWDSYALIKRIEQREFRGASAALVAMADDPVFDRRQLTLELMGRLAEHDPDLLAALVRIMRHDPEPWLREQALASIPAALLDTVREAVFGMSDDPHPGVRERLCHKLEDVRDLAATAILVRALGDVEPKVVVAACRGLGSPAAERALLSLDPLLQLLEHSERTVAAAAWYAAWMLARGAAHTARLGSIPVRTVLAWDLQGYGMFPHGNADTYEQFDRQAMAWGEERIGELVAALDDRYCETCINACRALIVVLSGEALPESFDGPEAEWALKKPSARAERARRVAAAAQRGIDVEAALLMAGSIAGKRAWKMVDEDTPDPLLGVQLRRLRLIALRGAESDAARQAAIQALDDAEDRVVIEAALNLALLDDRRAHEPLVRLLAGGAMVRRASAGLGLLRDQRAIEPLITALAKRDDRGVVSALAEVGDLRAIEPLIAALSSPSSDTRASAAVALGMLGDRRATPHIIGCLTHEMVTVRRMSAYALHLLGDRRAVEPLIARLADEDLTVVLFAIKILGEFGDARAADPLIALLDHRSTGLVTWVVEALERLPLTAEQRARLCSPTSSAAPAAPGSTPPPP